MPTRYALALATAAAAFAPAAAQLTGTCAPSTAESVLSADRLDTRVFNAGNLYFGNTTDAQYLVDGVQVMYAANLWVGGLVEGEPRTAAATYRDFEFWPGPLGADGLPANPSDCSAFDRIYRVTAEELASYEAGGAPALDLAEWPADLGAPVVDGDGIAGNYDLAAGDRPDLRGEATAFWIMNDAGNVHASSFSEPLGVEVRVVAFVSGTDSYYRVAVTNKSDEPIEDLRVGYFGDGDLGAEYEDDYVGSDPALDLVYTYNADNFDADAFGSSGFGAAPPAVGVSMLSGAGSASYFINEFGSGLEDPGSREEVWNTLQGLTAGGAPYTVGGIGTGDGTPTSFVFSGDPITAQGWSEVSAGNAPGDRRMLIVSEPQTLAPGASRGVDVAVLYARGADHLQSVGALRSKVSGVQALYADGSFFPGLPVASEATAPGTPTSLALRAFPNPAAGQVTLAYTVPAAGDVTLAVYDVLGRLVLQQEEGGRSADVHQAALDVSALPGGLYLAVAESAGQTATTRFTVVR